MAITDQREVARLKTAREDTFKVVQLQKINGKEVVDIREFLQDAPSRTNGSYTGFTRSGTSFPVEQIPELMKALQKAADMAAGKPVRATRKK